MVESTVHCGSLEEMHPTWMGEWQQEVFLEEVTEKASES